MKVDLVGKVKNTQLPRSKALLPMFEAVVNSFQSSRTLARHSGRRRLKLSSLAIPLCLVWRRMATSTASLFWKRAFDFTLEGDLPPTPVTESDERAPKTTVRLIGMRSPYKESCPLGLAVIGHRLIEHCLPFFLDPKCPAVTIADGQNRMDLNQYFRDTFAAKATQHTIKIGESSFTLRGLRLYNPHETHHRLIYAANSREVFPERLEKYLPNL
jgi:hypothetical protein